MNDHTKEPWITNADEESGWWHVLRDYHGKEIGSGDGGFEELDARRIVACVNACAGLDTGNLERGGLVSAVGHEMLNLDTRLAKLLAAFKEARSALQFANDSPCSGINDTIWMMHGPETLFDFMDAAIEEAERE